jgi:hypothetical protein
MKLGTHYPTSLRFGDNSPYALMSLNFYPKGHCAETQLSENFKSALSRHLQVAGTNFIPTRRDSFSAWLTKKEGTGKTCPFFEST